MGKYYTGMDPDPTFKEFIERGRSEGFYTHSGLMHTDDVLTWATLVACGVNPRTVRRVTRTDIDRGVVFDIGGGFLDHHQASAKLRDDGTKYAAFGLLFYWYGRGIVEYITGETDHLVQSAALTNLAPFIEAVDKTDNYGQKKFPNTLSLIINAMRDQEYDQRTADSTFISIACDMSYYVAALLKASVNEARNEGLAKAKINAALEKRCRFIDKHNRMSSAVKSSSRN